MVITGTLGTMVTTLRRQAGGQPSGAPGSAGSAQADAQGSVPVGPENTAQPNPQGSAQSADPSTTPDARGKSPQDPREQAALQQLKQTDRAVRAHEQAHMAAGGEYVTHAASYGYRRGPDGNLYAVSGEVGIDASEVSGDPRATLRKAMVVESAALAPADPSPQDRQVAAQAAQMAMKATMQLAAAGRGNQGRQAAAYLKNASGSAAGSFHVSA